MTAINPVYETYQRHRAGLEREHRSKYALVSSNEIVGIFDTAEDANFALRARFFSGPMVVYQVGQVK